SCSCWRATRSSRVVPAPNRRARAAAGRGKIPPGPMVYAGAALLLAAVLVFYLSVCAIMYRRLFTPLRPTPLDGFTFTPWEFQADYEELELETADGVTFGVWFFRQSGSQQAI